MKRQKFKLWHSVSGLVAAVAVQWLCLEFFPPIIVEWLVLVCAAAGALATIYVATEVIEEVRNARHMLTLLVLVVAEFVVFFACEYWLLMMALPSSFPTLPYDLTSALLHSVMVFVFNPIYLPGCAFGRALLLIDTLGALGLVLFILQNVWQFRNHTA
jgi:hypothetical protein